MRWLILDEVLTIESHHARSRGHYPASGGPAPQLLLMEMMAQTGGLILGRQSDFSEDVVFGKIEDAEFALCAESSEALEIEVFCENPRPEGAWMDGIVSLQERIIAKARFLLTGVGRLRPEVAHSVTFHQAFMDHFKIREKIR